MSRAAHFEMLGAPLHNVVWSWGAVRSDGTLFLLVWQDRTRPHNGGRYAQLTHRAMFATKQNDNGFQERERHAELIRNGARCFLIFGEAVDRTAVTRKIKDFDQDHLVPGGEVVELDGDLWVEMMPRVRVRDVMSNTSDRH